MSDKITIYYQLNTTISAEVDMADIIDQLNNQPLAKRWNAMAQIINNQIQLNELHELSPSQRKVILSWLELKTEKMKETIATLDQAEEVKE